MFELKSLDWLSINIIALINLGRISNGYSKGVVSVFCDDALLRSKTLEFGVKFQKFGQTFKNLKINRFFGQVKNSRVKF